MIKGTVRQQLSAENILSRVDDYSIYRYYSGTDFKLGRPFSSPMPGRRDSSPSFMINQKSGRLYHIDFGDAHYRGHCFDFVMQRYTCSYREALQMVDRDFGLGILSGENYNIRKAPHYKPPLLEERSYSFIQVATRKFTKNDLAYWNEYYLDISDLKAEQVYSIKEAWVNRKKITLTEDLRFGYLYQEKHWKIYQPFAGRGSKWISNVPIDVMDGLQNVQGPTTLVCKAKKDYLVAKKLMPSVCAVQNESVVAINEENVLLLQQKGGRVFIAYDSDEAGVTNCKKVTELFGFDYVNIPRQHLLENPPIKDLSDYARYFGMDQLEKFLQQKQIL